MKIAVSGKGGVGKTLVAGGLAAGFMRRGLKTIAIDADSSPNLAMTLGLNIDEARKILPISENKKLVESKTGTGYSGVFRLSFTVADIVKNYSVLTPSGVNLIVMGTVQSMDSGCMCAPNAVIRALLRHLVVERNEAVVMDFEAGVEHIGRGTAKHVDALLIIADSNLKSLQVATHIQNLANSAGMTKLFLVGNRIMNENQERAIKNYAEKNGLFLLDVIPFDPKIVEADMYGKTPILDKDVEAVGIIDNICDKLLKSVQS